VAIRTALTEAFGLEYPIILAPMASVAGGRLAAEVSNSGGLGLVGAGTVIPTGCARSCRWRETKPAGLGGSA
jgi:nitronate monooxygenase